MSNYSIKPRPDLKIIELEETTSTNDYIRHLQNISTDTIILITAERQLQGRGATGNWHSQKGKNLTFSIIYHPLSLPATQMFRLSMMICLSICRALNTFLPGCTIKWPNDIYYADKKLVGILIENELQGQNINRCVMGIGVNINQTSFPTSLTNPTSLALCLGYELDRSQVLEAIINAFFQILTQIVSQPWESLHAEYHSLLYRRMGLHRFQDKAGIFYARIQEVRQDGALLLRDESNRLRSYTFKEVSFLQKND